MKNKLLLSILIFITGVINITAQKESQFAIGVLGSIEGSKKALSFDMNAIHDYKSSSGNSIGIVANYKLNKTLFLKSELSYYWHCYDIEHHDPALADYEDPIFDQKTELTISYLRLPIKVGFHILRFGDVSFNPIIGFTTAFRLNSEETSIAGDKTTRESNYFKESSDKTQFDIHTEVEVKYNLKGKFDLYTAPFISKRLNNAKSGQYAYGVQFGVYYNL